TGRPDQQVAVPGVDDLDQRLVAHALHAGDARGDGHLLLVVAIGPQVEVADGGRTGRERSDDQQRSHALDEPPRQPHMASGGYTPAPPIAKGSGTGGRLTATGEAK